MWDQNIYMIRKTMGEYNQESYSAVVRAIQLKCIFLQRVTKNMGDAFAGVEKMFRETLLPGLFFGKSITLSPIVGTISKMLVNKADLGLLNPVTSAKEKYISLQREITELIQSVTGEGIFSNVNRLQALREERR